MADNEQAQAVESAPAEAADEEKGLLDQIIDKGNLAPEARERERARDLIGEFVGQIMDKRMVVSKDTETMINARISQIDQLISDQLNEVMHADAFQKLEVRGIGDLRIPLGRSHDVDLLPGILDELGFVRGHTTLPTAKGFGEDGGREDLRGLRAPECRPIGAPHDSLPRHAFQSVGHGPGENGRARAVRNLKRQRPSKSIYRPLRSSVVGAEELSLNSIYR